MLAARSILTNIQHDCAPLTRAVNAADDSSSGTAVGWCGHSSHRCRGGRGVVDTSTRQGVSGGADFEQPPVLESANGSLDVELTAAPYTARIAGQEAFVLGYNGSLPGP